MKKQKIILISILFLCVVFSIVIINHNKNIKKEIKIIKQMDESTQVTDLNAQITQLNTSHTEYANYVQNCKNTIATAITNQGVNTDANATAETMATNIEGILEARTSDANATAEDITEGKTAYVNGNLITGTLTLSSNDMDSISVGLATALLEKWKKFHITYADAEAKLMIYVSKNDINTPFSNITWEFVGYCNSGETEADLSSYLNDGYKLIRFNSYVSGKEMILTPIP